MTVIHHLSRLVKYVVAFLVIFVVLTYLVAARPTADERRPAMLINLLVSGTVTLAVFTARTWSKVTARPEP